MSEAYQLNKMYTFSGADPGFQVRGAHLKKIAPSGGSHENCWGISCEKIMILCQKIIFFGIAEGGAKIFWVFRVKNHDFMPTNHIFSNSRGRGCAVPAFSSIVQ